MSQIDRILTMISKWEPLGQGVFFLIILSGAVSFVLAIVRYLVILVRGWPREGEDS